MPERYTSNTTKDRFRYSILYKDGEFYCETDNDSADMLRDFKNTVERLTRKMETRDRINILCMVVYDNEEHKPLAHWGFEIEQLRKALKDVPQPVKIGL